MTRANVLKIKRHLAWQRWDDCCRTQSGQWEKLKKSAEWFLLWDRAYTKEVQIKVFNCAIADLS